MERKFSKCGFQTSNLGQDCLTRKRGKIGERTGQRRCWRDQEFEHQSGQAFLNAPKQI